MLFDKMKKLMNSHITTASKSGCKHATLVCKISMKEIDETIESEEKLYNELTNEGFKIEVTEETKTLHRIKASW